MFRELRTSFDARPGRILRAVPQVMSLRREHDSNSDSIVSHPNGKAQQPAHAGEALKLEQRKSRGRAAAAFGSAMALISFRFPAPLFDPAYFGAPLYAFASASLSLSLSVSGMKRSCLLSK